MGKKTENSLELPYDAIVAWSNIEGDSTFTIQRLEPGFKGKTEVTVTKKDGTKVTAYGAGVREAAHNLGQILGWKIKYKEIYDQAGSNQS